LFFLTSRNALFGASFLGLLLYELTENISTQQGRPQLDIANAKLRVWGLNDTVSHVAEHSIFLYNHTEGVLYNSV
jgi:hypothetical protein